MSRRIRYFINHLMVSVSISICAVLWVFFVWYPIPLNKAVGLTSIFLMMVVIDVIIGPILSLIVYKQHKKTLKIDLLVIIILQILALLYGMYNIAKGRPVWLVYNVDRFELVSNHEIYWSAINEMEPEYKKVTWLRPRYIATKFAEDANQRRDDMLDEALAGISIAQRPERYVPLDSVATQIQKRTLPITLLDKYNPANQVQSIAIKYPTATGYVPLKANAVDMTVLVDKEGKVVKIVDLRPW